MDSRQPVSARQSEVVQSVARAVAAELARGSTRTHLLFSGRSGTGKTMAAETLASQLDVDLYKVDLSRVVTKYVGETEKRLRRVFADAESSDAILFFDEADALFGSRSRAKDSDDRYGNLDAARLLTLLEEHPGPVILAVNRSDGIDPAIVRRLRVVDIDDRYEP